MGVDDERSKNTFEIEFLMRSDMSKSSFTDEICKPCQSSNTSIHIHYTIFVKTFSPVAHSLRLLSLIFGEKHAKKN